MTGAPPSQHAGKIASSMEPRAVSVGHGWTWIVQGFALFRKSPAVWLAVLLLFVLARVFDHGARMREELEGTV